MKFFLAAILAATAFLSFQQPLFAQTEAVSAETFEAKIIEVGQPKVVESAMGEQSIQILKLEVTSGERHGEQIQVEQGAIPQVNTPEFKVGDKVVVESTIGADNQPYYQITDFVRRAPLYLLAALFVIVVLAVQWRKGLLSLLATGLSFAILFGFVFPQILNGADPVFISIVAALLIIPLNFYLSHGLNRKTTIAVVGTLVVLTFSLILGKLFVDATKLTGYSSDEAGMLGLTSQGLVHIKGLILASIVLGLAGVLDDVTISQSSIVEQLKQTQPDMPMRQLYNRSMAVGRDHVASLVNTLILVYASASMPLLLLFSTSTQPFSQIINYEVVAEEIVRTLTVSIGVVLAVPLVSLLAAYYYTKPAKS